jgi:hypothetical protein
MPIEYTIDIPRRFILTTASGEVTAPEVMNHQNRLMRDPFFDPTFSQLVDFSSVTRVAIPSPSLAGHAQFLRASSKKVFGRAHLRNVRHGAHVSDFS